MTWPAHTWVILVHPILSYFPLTSPLLLTFMQILCVSCVNPVLSHGLGVFACLCLTCRWVQCLIVLKFSVLPIFHWWFISSGHHEFNIWLFMSFYFPPYFPPSTCLYADSLCFVHESGSLSWPWGICMLVSYLLMSSMSYCSWVQHLANISLVIHFRWSPWVRHLAALLSGPLTPP